MNETQGSLMNNSVPSEVNVSFATAVPGHSGVSAWYWNSTPGIHWFAEWKNLSIYAKQNGDDWYVESHLPAFIGGRSEAKDADLTTAIRESIKGAITLLQKYANKQKRAAMRRLDRADQARNLAMEWKIG